jgi:poly-gamma-glutamate capsule biosynthesis protein CapA/YwtB (metallophosphatase superfamily)
MGDGLLTLCLCGDVMLGRGIDQILPNPGDPTLRETQVHDARAYVELAERTNGPIPRPVDFAWPWGDALGVLADSEPDVWIVNLETSITSNDDFAPSKGIHYRMSPANLPCLLAASPDAAVLANNHVLDFGRRGLQDTLDALSVGAPSSRASLSAPGAGPDQAHARRPAAIAVGDRARVLIFAFGMPSSGIPGGWAASDDRAGVDFVGEPSDAAAAEIAERVRRVKRPGDVVVASIHWGSNWGYEVFRDQEEFAHRLIDGGVDLIHGHSSHHPRPIEVYQDRVILYGCGDFINDYEGIGGHAAYRNDLRLLYRASVEVDSGRLVDLRMAPMQARQMRLRHASRTDGEWLRAALDRCSCVYGSRVDIDRDGTLVLRRGSASARGVEVR